MFLAYMSSSPTRFDAELLSSSQREFLPRLCLLSPVCHGTLISMLFSRPCSRLCLILHSCRFDLLPLRQQRHFELITLALHNDRTSSYIIDFPDHPAIRSESSRCRCYIVAIGIRESEFQWPQSSWRAGCRIDCRLSTSRWRMAITSASSETGKKNTAKLTTFNPFSLPSIGHTIPLLILRRFVLRSSFFVMFFTFKTSICPFRS